MLTLKAALEEATASVGRTDAHVIVAHLLGVDRAYLAANRAFVVDTVREEMPGVVLQSPDGASPSLRACGATTVGENTGVPTQLPLLFPPSGALSATEVPPPSLQ